MLVDKQNNRKRQLCSQRQRVNPVDTDISFYLKRKRLANRLTLQMHIIVQPAFLNIVKFIFPVDSLNRLTGQVKYTLHAEHESEICNRI